MRIVSDFKDFYDGFQSMYQDSDLVYYRKTEKANLSVCPFMKLGHIWGIGTTLNVVGFCGKIYPCISVRPSGFIKPKVDYKDIVCYDINDVDDLVRKHYDEKQISWYLKGEGKKGKKYIDRAFFEDFFIKFDKEKDKYSSFFGKYPIFCAFGTFTTLSYNVSLRNLDFHKIKDAFTTFHELRVFISGIAQPNKEIPILDDKIKIELAGFDNKYSFRKDKK